MTIQTLGTSALKGEVLDAQDARADLAKAMEVLTIAKAVVIKTDEDYAAADAMVASIKNAQKAAENKRTSLVKPLNDTVKKINAEFKPVDSTFEEALGYYRRPMSAYQAELARQRAEAEALARKERELLEAEAKAKAEAEIAAAAKLREEAEAAKAQAADTDDPFLALLAEQEAEEAVRAAEAQGESAKQAIRDTRVVLPAAPEVAKVTGSASKTHTVWKHRITDPTLVPLKYRPIDEKLISADIRVMKGEFNEPGIEVYSEIEVR